MKTNITLPGIYFYNLDASSSLKMSKLTELQELMQVKILLLDGAYGTEFQALELEEDDYRGERFESHSVPLQGNHDILCITSQMSLKTFTLAFLKLAAT